MIVGGLVFAQYRRIIEGKDLLIIAGITAVFAFFFPGSMPLPNAITIAVVASLAGIAVTALFRLIYLLLSRFL
jgi:serine/threonine-protein kinase